jgi:hypothetical protein
MRILPERRVGAVVIANRSGSGLDRTLDAAMETVLGPSRGETTAASGADAAVTPEDVAALEGRWANGRASVVEFKAAGGALTATVGTSGTALPVRRGADGRYRAGGQAFSVITGKDGKTRYLVAGARAYRREEAGRGDRAPND